MYERKVSKTTIYFEGEFQGLYRWGEGWTAETKNAWSNYWKNIKGCFWHAREINGTFYLITIGGSIYLHPMNFSGCLVDCGVRVDGKYFKGEIRELNKLCEDCAKALGVGFTLYTTDEVRVDFGETAKYEKDIDE